MSNDKLVQVTILARDLKRLKQWAAAEQITPELFLGRLIRDERIKRSRRSGNGGAP